MRSEKAGTKRLVVLAAEEEVVPQGQDHVEIGLEDEAAEQARESRLDLGGIEREQLLELVHDQRARARGADGSGCSSDTAVSGSSNCSSACTAWASPAKAR